MSVTDSAVAPGGTVNLQFTGLFPHRDYCFVLTSADSSLNVATSATVERSFALRASDGLAVPATSYDATDTIDTRSPLEALTRYWSDGSVISDIDAKVVGLPDFDGDGEPDFAVRTSFNKEPDGTKNRYTEIRLFLKALAMVVELKTNGSVSSSAYRRAGKGVFAAGDVNNDGLSDLIIDIQEFASSGGSKAGGVLVYLGQATSTGWSTTTNANDELLDVTPSVAV